MQKRINPSKQGDRRQPVAEDVPKVARKKKPITPQKQAANPPGPIRL